MLRSGGALHSGSAKDLLELILHSHVVWYGMAWWYVVWYGMWYVVWYGMWCGVQQTFRSSNTKI